jgi:hypothetical protein
MFGSGATASCVIRVEDNDAFFNPTLGLTGFSFDGKHYINGVLDPLQMASWATEGRGDNRGATIEFPRESVILTSATSLTIFDQSTNPFTVWMSFIQGDMNALLDNFSPTRVLDTGNLTFDASTKTIIRSLGSWPEDGVKIGDSITFSGFVGNNLTVTVAGYMTGDTSLTGIIVNEAIVDANEFGTTTIYPHSRLEPKAIQYCSGRVTVSFVPEEGSYIEANVFLHLDFVQDQAYADFSNYYASTDLSDLINWNGFYQERKWILNQTKALNATPGYDISYTHTTPNSFAGRGNWTAPNYTAPFTGSVSFSGSYSDAYTGPIAGSVSGVVVTDYPLYRVLAFDIVANVEYPTLPYYSVLDGSGHWSIANASAGYKVAKLLKFGEGTSQPLSFTNEVISGSGTSFTLTALGGLTSQSPTISTLTRTDWQGTIPLLPTSRTNSFWNSLLTGGGAAPTGWTQPTATGTSTPGASTLGGPGTAYTQTATAQRPYLSQTVTLNANTSYCFSMLVEAVSGGLTAQEVLGGALPSGTITYPVCPANPSGTAAGTLTTGILTTILTIGATSGATTLRCGIGTVAAGTGTIRFSHPQVELGTVRTSFIPTPTGGTASVTDYTLSGATVTLAQSTGTGTLKWTGTGNFVYTLVATTDYTASIDPNYAVELWKKTDIEYYIDTVPALTNQTWSTGNRPWTYLDGDYTAKLVAASGTPGSRAEITRNHGGLVRSYIIPPTDSAYASLSNRCYAYDQAVALIASLAYKVQDPNTPDFLAEWLIKAQDSTSKEWYFSFDATTGLSVDPYYRTGAHAWCCYALLLYAHLMPEGQFATAATTAARAGVDRLLQDKATVGPHQLIKGGRGVYTNDVYANAPIAWFSTEHNIDCYFALQACGHVTGVSSYTTEANSLKTAIVAELWNADAERFYQGFNGTPDTADALDLNTWGAMFLLAAGETAKATAASINALAFRMTVGLVTGFVPYLPDRGYPGVSPYPWSEGTFQYELLARKLGSNSSTIVTINNGILPNRMPDYGWAYSLLPDQVSYVSDWGNVAGTAWAIIANEPSLYSIVLTPL